ncbi:MAG: hypothetical protein ABL874_01495 [Sphingopyxis sp.]
MAEATSKNIDGITDLVVVAPIKHGFIEAFENITYESRLKLVAEALHKIRVNAREHELVAPFADTAERILSLFNFRIGVLDHGQFSAAKLAATNGFGGGEPQRYMFLVATFDGPWEPYMRLIWKPLGPFLDLLLCNCDGYKLATRTGFPEYADWVRRHQVEPSIFYSTTKLTVRDHIYLAQLEKLQRELDPRTAVPPTDQQLAALTMEDPEAKASAVWGNPPEVREALRLSFEALAVLYRLADFFPPDRVDGGSYEGAVLVHAAKELLLGLPKRIEAIIASNDLYLIGILIVFGVIPDPAGQLPQQLRPYYEAWTWFTSLPGYQPLPELEFSPPVEEVQKGLLSSYDDEDWQVTHGLVLFMQIVDADKAAGSAGLQFLGPSWESGTQQGGDDLLDRVIDTADIRLFRNLAFTAAGLGHMGMTAAELAHFSKEFRDGLFDRAPQLGDKRAHHPRRWQMPLRYDRSRGGDDTRRPTVHPEEVDVILQWRLAKRIADISSDPDHIDFEAGGLKLHQELHRKRLLKAFRDNISSFVPALQSAATITANITMADDESSRLTEIQEVFDAADPLAVLAFILSQAEDVTGLRLIAVESAFRPLTSNKPTDPRYNRDHFDFIDGISQPIPTNDHSEVPVGHFDDRVPFGDVVVGYRNSRGDRAADHRWHGGTDYQANGSFVVFRKIAQFPDRLAALSDMEAEAMVGRKRDGQPLIAGHAPLSNDFLYDGDKEQKQCPFSAHIRLANPRDQFHGRSAPRILRRGMSYGQRWQPADPNSAAEPRGLLFIAYNASLAEQYEVIQRWLNGGNATDVASAANDPLTGPAQEPGARTFRYRTTDGAVARVKLERPLTELQWGIYGFAPSRSALENICGLSRQPTPDQVAAQAGGAIINRLLALPAEAQRQEWKRLLEDFVVKDSSELNEAPRVWQAIRERRDGVLRVEAGMAYGGGADATLEQQAAKQPMVLVADGAAIMDVLSRPQDFSVAEQGRRTHASFGDIYVAMDPDPADTPTTPISRYAKESIATNTIVYGFSEGQQDAVFNAAYRIAKARLGLAQDFASKAGMDFYKVELRRDFLVPVLAALSKALFDIPDVEPYPPKPGHIDPGPWGWAPIDMAGSTVATQGQRKPRCPADFMAPSRYCFYPRPSGAIQEYGKHQGNGLRAASVKLVKAKRASGFKGLISQTMAVQITDDDLLARNIIGIMEGMLPPLDGIMRGVIFDWTEQKTLWRHQSDFLAERPAGIANLDHTRAALQWAVETAMCKRPAPDLIYRTAVRDTAINGKKVRKGDLIILGLVSPMLASLDAGAPDIIPVFGGQRTAAWQLPGTPTHACPAYAMVMAMIYGMIAALFDAGRITVQPASLILQISDWTTDTVPPKLSEGLYSPFTMLDENF